MAAIRILFVDDDRYKSKPLLDYFTLVEDWEVMYETTPRGALEIVKSRAKEIDVILLDVMMPPDEVVDEGRSEMGQATGLLLLEAITSITGGSIPVIILSARQDLHELLDRKVARYLQKPQTATEIVQSIYDVVSGTAS